MGEYSDLIVDRMIFGSYPYRPRKRSGFQSGSGDFMWRDSTGKTVSMYDMTDEYLSNAIAVCERKGNGGKAAQLRAVLHGRTT